MFSPLDKSAFGRWALLPLAGWIGLGAYLRLHGLGMESLWFDEICSFQTSSHDSLGDVVHKDIEWHYHPPAYHILLHYWQKIFGISEFALRLPSAIAGILSIPAVYLLGTRLYTFKEGILASGLIAVLVFPVYYSQEARPYSILLLVSIVATLLWTYCFENLHERKKTSRKWIGAYVALAWLTMYTHYFGLFFIMLQGAATLAAFARNRQALTRSIAVYAVIGLGYFPWLPSMWLQWSNPGAGHQTPGAPFHLAFFQLMEGFYNFGYAGFGRLIVLNAGLGVVYVAGATVAAWQFFRRASDDDDGTERLYPIFFLLAWLFGPFVFAYTKSVLSESVYTYRNLIVSLPAALILLSRAVTTLPQRANILTVVACLSLLVWFYALAFRSDYYTVPHKDQYREATGWISDNDKQLGNTLVVGYSHQDFLYDYYFRRWGATSHVDMTAGKAGDIDLVKERLIENKPEFVWYIFDENLKPEAPFVEFLNLGFTGVAKQDFLRVHVVLLRPDWAKLAGI